MHKTGLQQVVIFGGTGFIGRLLQRFFRNRYQVTIVSRSADGRRNCLPENNFNTWDGHHPSQISAIVPADSIVINLAGASIACRWSPANRRAICHSRIDYTHNLTRGLLDSPYRPKLYIQASAVGWYGPQVDRATDETAPPGQGFLAQVCRDWENASAELDNSPIRRVIMRLGVLLAPSGGFLARALGPLFPWLVLMPGRGANCLSWIHGDDLAGATQFFIETQATAGVYNLTAPQAATTRELFQLLARHARFKRPIPIPAAFIRLALGQMATELVFCHQRILPARLQQAGFTYQYPALTEAVDTILSNRIAERPGHARPFAATGADRTGSP